MVLYCYCFTCKTWSFKGVIPFGLHAKAIGHYCIKITMPNVLIKSNSVVFQFLVVYIWPEWCVPQSFINAIFALSNGTLAVSWHLISCSPELQSTDGWHIIAAVYALPYENAFKFKFKFKNRLFQLLHIRSAKIQGTETLLGFFAPIIWP